MLDAVLGAGDSRCADESAAIPRSVSEVNAVIGERGVDAAGHRLDNFPKEGSRCHLPGFRHKRAEGELGAAVDCDKHP
jgi:hypothetical protein